MRKAVYKVPNGKLLKVFVEGRDGNIVDIKITGDFFMHPEERISELEQKLRGATLELTSLRTIISDFFSTTGTTTFGVDPESIALCIMQTQEQT